MPGPSRRGWELTREALHALLTHLGPDEQAAALRYEALRERLIRIFRWERCSNPEDCADEALNRIARKIQEGETIRSFEQYASGVAHFVILEARAEERATLAFQREINPQSVSHGDEDRAVECLEHCLRQLEPESKKLLLSYYSHEGRQRAEHRKQMAVSLGVDVNALRNRALRLREKLESCISRCLSGDPE